MDHEQKSSSEGEKVEEIVLPGFRFHPTDEELVGFYLKKKIQDRPLSIELIKQLDIYKYDPWDLPKMAASGEKEWYFYCPRDRKYRNSTRPNRVTRAGFWKATGTDRPVYSSSSELGSSKCIGLKKSLVFYRGRAAKGTKTDWMMHEFRLPSSSHHLTNKPCPPHPTTTESWAICRIFRKTSSVAHRTTSRSWISPNALLPQQPNLILNSNTRTTTSPHHPADQLTPESMAFVSMKTEPLPPIQQINNSNGEYNYSSGNEVVHVDNSSTLTTTTDFSHFDFPPYSNHQHEMMLPPLMDASLSQYNNGDISCVLGDHYVGNNNNSNESCMSLELGDLHQQLIIGNGGVFSNGSTLLLQEDSGFDRRDDLWDVVKSFRFPISAASDIAL